ncbi:MAG: hypothetical protein CL927_15950 [Deltaproteobacteria bacterium]|nr:hypothetical protein [Deltaproteobacteria bacterium]HCH62432.1 hypothetical protein [Deltaproteobacteria bacterium]
MNRPRRGHIAIAAVYLGLSLSLTSFHAFQVNFGPKEEVRAQRHTRIVAMEEGLSPWAYRVAVPIAVERRIEPALRTIGVDPEESREYAYLVVRFAATWLTLLLSHALIRRFTSDQMALGGTLLIGALHGPSIEHYWFQPASGPDHVLWLTTALLALSKRDAWVYAVVFLGAFNRETIVFAIPIYLALRWGTEEYRRTLERTFVMGLLWLLPFIWLRGVVELRYSLTPTVHEYAWQNFTNFEWQFYAFAFAGAWGVVPLLGWRLLPRPLRALMCMMVPYLALVLAFGRIREVRLLLPTTVAFVPAAMVVLNAWLKQDTKHPLRETSGPS